VNKDERLKFEIVV